MKKTFRIAVAAIALSLTGCGGTDDVSDTPTTTGSSSSTSSTESTVDTSSSPSPPAQAGGDYCQTLEDAKNRMESLDFTQLDEDTYGQLQIEIAKVTSVAPPDIQDDWVALGTALDDIHKLLADAGISFDDLQAMSRGEIPPGVDPQALQRLAPKMQQLASSSNLEQSSKAIEASAKQDCGLNLSN